jgi:hypothetical protein
LGGFINDPFNQGVRKIKTGYLREGVKITILSDNTNHIVPGRVIFRRYRIGFRYGKIQFGIRPGTDGHPRITNKGHYLRKVNLSGGSRVGSFRNNRQDGVLPVRLGFPADYDFLICKIKTEACYLLVMALFPDHGNGIKFCRVVVLGDHRPGRGCGKIAVEIESFIGMGIAQRAGYTDAGMGDMGIHASGIRPCRDADYNGSGLFIYYPFSYPFSSQRRIAGSGYIKDKADNRLAVFGFYMDCDQIIPG